MECWNQTAGACSGVGLPLSTDSQTRDSLKHQTEVHRHFLWHLINRDSLITVPHCSAAATYTTPQLHHAHYTAYTLRTYTAARAYWTPTLQHAACSHVTAHTMQPHLLPCKMLRNLPVSHLEQEFTHSSHGGHLQLLFCDLSDFKCVQIQLHRQPGCRHWYKIHLRHLPLSTAATPPHSVLPPQRPTQYCRYNASLSTAATTPHSVLPLKQLVRGVLRIREHNTSSSRALFMKQP